MDTIQALTFDIPVKAYQITPDTDKMRNILRKNAVQFLKHNGNYFANGIVYPNTLEVIEWHSGIKRGGILSDVMVFTTTIRACFRMYPIGSVHTGTIKSISTTSVQINDEYIYDIEVPIVKTQTPVDIQSTLITDNMFNDDSDSDSESEDEEMFAWTNEKIEATLKNNNPLYPYLAGGINPSNLAVGQTVEFIVLELSSRENHANVIVLSFLTRIIDSYTKIYSVNCGNQVLQHPKVKTTTSHELSLEDILPSYYKSQDIYYAIGDNIGAPFTNVDKPVDSYYMCYYKHNPEFTTSLFDNVVDKSIVIIEMNLAKDVTSPLTEGQYNQICKHFADVTMYYNWPTAKEDTYTLWIVCSYHI